MHTLLAKPCRNSKKALSLKANTLAEAKGQLRSLATRLGRSSNTELMSEQLQETQSLQSKIDTLLEFVKSMKNTRAPDLEQATKVAEEVQQWYVLSKPYQLKLFDMRIQYASLFGDVESACKMMTAGSKELEPLQQHCFREELVSVACTACEDMVMDILKAAKKNPQTGAMSVSPEHGAHLEKMLAYGHGPGDVPEFMAADFLPALEVATSIVLCRQVPVSRLSSAVHKLEESAEIQGDDASPSGCALFQFLLGKGKALYTPAASVLQERQQELLHEQMVNDLDVAGAEIASRAAQGAIVLWPARTCLEDAEQFLAKANASLKKKKGGVPLSSAHKTSVQQTVEKVAVAARRLVVQELKGSVVCAMQTCEEARNNGGYVASDATSEDGTPMRALVKLPELKARLDCDDLLDHTIWKTLSVPPTEAAQWQTHRKLSGFMYRVLAFTLVGMPAYANLKLELPSDGLWPDWERLQEWLLSQLPADLVAAWNAHWAGPVQEEQKKSVGNACGRIRALLTECTAGRPGSIDGKTVENILAPLPETDLVVRFLGMFFAAVIAYTGALAGGSLATAAQISNAKTKLGLVVEAWPEAAQSKLHELCGLADPALRKWTTDALSKMAQYHARTLAGGHKELDALVAKAGKLLERVPHGDECKFREKMRKDGTAIASTQNLIGDLLVRMKRADPALRKSTPQVWLRLMKAREQPCGRHSKQASAWTTSVTITRASTSP